MRRNSLKATTLLIAYVAWVVLLRVDVGEDLIDTTLKEREDAWRPIKLSTTS